MWGERGLGCGVVGWLGMGTPGPGSAAAPESISAAFSLSDEEESPFIPDPKGVRPLSLKYHVCPWIPAGDRHHPAQWFPAWDTPWEAAASIKLVK